jgi:voltage-gated potassium channel
MPPREQRRSVRDGVRAWWTGGGNLLAVLVFYFVVPVSTEDAPLALLLSALVALVAVGVVALIVVREALRLASGDGPGLRGLHVVLALEIVLVGFAFIYYLLAVFTTQQMSGIDTRLDALYFSAVTTMTVGFGDLNPIGQLARGVVTAHLVFNVAFVAAVTSLLRGNFARSPDTD